MLLFLLLFLVLFLELVRAENELLRDRSGRRLLLRRQRRRLQWLLLLLLHLLYHLSLHGNREQAGEHMLLHDWRLLGCLHLLRRQRLQGQASLGKNTRGSDGELGNDRGDTGRRGCLLLLKYVILVGGARLCWLLGNQGNESLKSSDVLKRKEPKRWDNEGNMIDSGG